MQATCGEQERIPVNKLIRQVQEATKGVSAYFSLSTALSIAAGLTPTRVFVVLPTGARVQLPEGVNYIKVDIENFNYDKQSALFDIEKILVDCQTMEVVGPKEALNDIESKTISYRHTPKELWSSPEHILRLAYIISYTGFTCSDLLLRTARFAAKYLPKLPSSIIWKWMSIILPSAKPDDGINFLRSVFALQVILPELHACIDVGQNKKYHKYTVYEHCVKACAAAEPDLVLRTAALLHDIGKPLVKQEIDGNITFHKHEVESTRLTRKVMNRWGVPRATAEPIIKLVSLHMYQYDRVWKDSTVLRFARRAGITAKYIGHMDQVKLFKLRQCDRIGRDLEPITQKQMDLEKRLESLLVRHSN